MSQSYLLLFNRRQFIWHLLIISLDLYESVCLIKFVRLEIIDGLKLAHIGNGNAKSEATNQQSSTSASSYVCILHVSSAPFSLLFLCLLSFLLLDQLSFLYSSLASYALASCNQILWPLVRWRVLPKGIHNIALKFLCSLTRNNGNLILPPLFFTCSPVGHNCAKEALKRPAGACVSWGQKSFHGKIMLVIKKFANIVLE